MLRAAVESFCLFITTPLSTSMIHRSGENSNLGATLFLKMGIAIFILRIVKAKRRP